METNQLLINYYKKEEIKKIIDDLAISQGGED